MTWIYILKCADDSYYTGLTDRSVETRVLEHNHGDVPGYTSKRRPVKLVYAEEFPNAVDANAAERKIKGWSRKKKEALIDGDFNLLRALSKRGSA